MVGSSTDLQADVVFVIESTANNGAYINDIKSNYIIPTLEYFSQGSIDETNYFFENSNSLYGIVVYHAADCLPHLSSDTFGPFSSPSKLLGAIERLELIGGRGESHANVGEGLATALCCFEELQQKRDPNAIVQKHCILVCNSPPYALPVLECHQYSGQTAEQLAGVLLENNINLSIIAPRKIPILYKLFEKAGGDLTTSQTKNYAKDPRHLVLLKGYSLKERPVSPPPGTASAAQPQIPSNIPITSMPSPLTGNDSPIHTSQQNPNLMGPNTAAGIPPGMGQNPVYRPPVTGMNQLPVRMMGNTQMAMGMQQMPAPPGYHAATGPRSGPWQMPPPSQQPQGPYSMPNQNPIVSNVRGSALIAQLKQPPGNGVNQFAQMNANSPISNMQLQSTMQGTMAQNPAIQPSMGQVSQQNQVIPTQSQVNPPPTQTMGGRERHTIWQGFLEWIDKNKNASDQQKITRQVPCQVTANSKDGEPEMKADGWPTKLLMQLMPKQLIGNIGGSYLKNSKSVLFHPQQCEALESLTRVMNSGFAGCVHFTSPANHIPCDIKVLILLYTADKKAYLGFIPNDQTAFVDRLRKVIQQQKRQGGNGGPSMNPQTVPQMPMGVNQPQMSVSNPVTSQSTQQGLMISQTNTLSMGGGQITQNVSAASPSGSTLGNMVGPNVPGAGQRPNIRMQGMQQGTSQQPMPPNMMGAPGPRGPFENQLQVERQQNLEKINQLRQTLEAAQQQEQQYKSQLERISHMKTTQLQEALHMAQQTEMQYKLMDQQRMANQGNPQATNVQQQRMMRPVMTNNPGLRHLLQQQPQYRQQMINMQQMGGNNARAQMGQQMGSAGNSQQNTFDDVSNFVDFNLNM